MSNWFVYENLARIRQDEIIHEARSTRMNPINLRTVLANRRWLLVMGLPLSLVLIARAVAA